MEWFLNHRPDLAKLVSRWQKPGVGERRLLSLFRGHRIKRLLRRMLDETEFLERPRHACAVKDSSNRRRSLRMRRRRHDVRYRPGERRAGLFGGNSNWPGPVWLPMNFLIIESLQKIPPLLWRRIRGRKSVGSGKFLNLDEAA